jgi:seryl-tRNA synthetase
LFYRLAACSRCYRAELPGGKSEGNLYRVHEFTKVEMFAVTVDDEKVSQEMHNEIVRLQASMFEELGLHFRFNYFFI